MKLYWSSRSPFARKAMLAAHETGQATAITCVPVVVSPFRLNLDVDVDNPLARIPALVAADGLVIHGSAVICEYLDGLTAVPQLLPADPSDRLHALTLQSLGDGLMDTLVFWSAVRSRFEGPHVQSLASASRQKIASTLDFLERCVDGLGGEKPHVGALAVAACLGYLDFRYANESWRSGRPALADWAEGFENRPSARATRHCE